MSRKILFAIVIAAISILGGCGAPSQPSTRGDGVPSRRGLNVSRGRIEAYFTNFLETSFSETTEPDQPKRTTSDERDVILVELLGDDDNLGQVTLKFSWSMDPETGVSDPNDNQKAKQCIGRLCHLLEMPEGTFGDLYKDAIENHWTPKHGGQSELVTSGKLAQLMIIPVTIRQAKQFTGKGMFVAFRISAKE